MRTGVTLLAALIFAATAAASTRSAGTDMATAVKALHYPKTSLKMGCRKAGSGFNCKATYRRNRTQRFYAAWAADGGYICAGPKAATCKILRHGFMSNLTVGGDVEGAAEQAARGYMTIHYQDPQPFIAPGCTQPSGAASWSFCYKLDTGSVNVTVHMGRVRPGYVTTVTAATY